MYSTRLLKSMAGPSRGGCASSLTRVKLLPTPPLSCPLQMGTRPLNLLCPSCTVSGDLKQPLPALVEKFFEDDDGSPMVSVTWLYRSCDLGDMHQKTRPAREAYRMDATTRSFASGIGQVSINDGMLRISAVLGRKLPKESCRKQGRGRGRGTMT